MTNRYTPGHSATSISFMAARDAETHAAFFLPELAPGLSLLDLGCGPGTITVGLAGAVAPGAVLGIDQGGEQLDGARRLAAGLTLDNVTFAQSSCYSLDLADESVDRVFSHALLEHLDAPLTALGEAYRVLRPGGRIGVRSPDWQGFLLAPTSSELDRAISTYVEMQQGNGGDPYVGRRLGELLADSGFVDVRLDAEYERYADAWQIADYLAQQLAAKQFASEASTLRSWATHPRAMFAQSWVSAIATRP